MAEQSAPRHHPPEALLIEHAAGHLELAQRATLEAHLAFCPACRRSLAGWSAPGAALLAAGAAEALPDLAWKALESRLDAVEASGDRPPFAPPPALPPGLRGHLPPRLYSHPWRRVPLSSARYSVVDSDARTGATLLLLHVPPARIFPRHEHLGCEDVVVLTGSFRDPSGHFRPGDFQRSGAGTVHRPEVQPGEACWILASFEAGVRFTGLRGVIQRLASAAGRSANALSSRRPSNHQEASR